MGAIRTPWGMSADLGEVVKRMQMADGRTLEFFDVGGEKVAYDPSEHEFVTLAPDENGEEGLTGWSPQRRTVGAYDEDTGKTVINDDGFAPGLESLAPGYLEYMQQKTDALNRARGARRGGLLGNGYLGGLAEFAGPASVFAGGIGLATSLATNGLAATASKLAMPALRGAGTSLLTGGDPLRGAVSGGLGGANEFTGAIKQGVSTAWDGLKGAAFNAGNFSGGDMPYGFFDDILGVDDWDSFDWSPGDTDMTGFMGNDPSDALFRYPDFGNDGLNASGNLVDGPDYGMDWVTPQDPEGDFWRSIGMPMPPDGMTMDLRNSGPGNFVPITNGGGVDGWTRLADGVKSIFGGGKTPSLPGAARSLFGGGADLLGQGLASIPILAAINYARNQGPFDTSRLDAIDNSIPTRFSTDRSGFDAAAGAIPTNFRTDTGRLESSYDALDPGASARNYDLATGAGRTMRTADLARRGVMGSSFAGFDLDNYDMTRDVGRAQIVNDALLKRAGIAGNIAEIEGADTARALTGAGLRTNLAVQDANVRQGDDARALTAAGLRGTLASNALTAETKRRQLQNDLYGRSLLALGSVFSPRPSYGGRP